MGKTLILLVGESGSGKSTIENELCKFKGFRKAVSHTTRPMREGEKNGVDYWFVSSEEFERMLVGGQFAESTIYNQWGYAISKEDLYKGNDNVVLVIEPVGYKQLIEEMKNSNIDIVSFYVKTSGKERLLRSLIREKNPNCKEICRRYLSDLDLFDGLQVDYVLDNEDGKLSQSVATVVQILSFFKFSKSIKDKIKKDKIKK